jgi:hypothetical protein
MQWLLEHVDLALPFPAAKFLDSILAETKQRGVTDPSAFDELQRDFLQTTEAFADFDNHLRTKCPDIPGAGDRVAEVLGKIASQPFGDGAGRDEVKTILLGDREDDSIKVESWLFDTFPVKAEGGRIRFVSRLFFLWWRSQIAEVKVTQCPSPSILARKVPRSSRKCSSVATKSSTSSSLTF